MHVHPNSQNTQRGLHRVVHQAIQNGRSSHRTCRVGQSHIYTAYIRYYGLKITKYTVHIYVYIRFWPTLCTCRSPSHFQNRRSLQDSKGGYRCSVLTAQHTYTHTRTHTHTHKVVTGVVSWQLSTHTHTRTHTHTQGGYRCSVLTAQHTYTHTRTHTHTHTRWLPV